MNKKLELADIATNEKKLLRGFKVLGVFPFYLRYITTRTHVQLCKIQEQIAHVAPEKVTNLEYNDYKLMSELTPFLIEYALIGLLNSRNFSFFLRPLLKQKLKKCGHYHLLNLYMTIYNFDNPTFFLSYWPLIRQKKSTLLKEDEQY